MLDDLSGAMVAFGWALLQGARGSRRYGHVVDYSVAARIDASCSLIGYQRRVYMSILKITRSAACQVFLL